MRARFLSIPILTLALGVVLGAGCASSRPLNTQEERRLKVDLVKQHAREMSPVQRTAFLGIRFGTEDLVRERLMKMLEANRIYGRSVARDRATVMELYKIQPGARVTRIGPGADATPPTGEDP